MDQLVFASEPGVLKCVLRLFLTFFVVIGSLQTQAVPIQIGLLAFDPLVAADPPDPGTNAFRIYNLTGDPLLGGFASPPDFPAFTPLKFTSAGLSVVVSSIQQAVALPDIDPGIFSNPDLEFSGAISIESATFTATVDASVVTLNDGTSWTFTTQQLSATLLPGSGSELAAGIDTVVLALDAVPLDLRAVPEPSTVVLMAAGLTLLLACARRLK